MTLRAMAWTESFRLRTCSAECPLGAQVLRGEAAVDACVEHTANKLYWRAHATSSTSPAVLEVSANRASASGTYFIGDGIHPGAAGHALEPVDRTKILALAAVTP